MAIRQLFSGVTTLNLSVACMANARLAPYTLSGAFTRLLAESRSNFIVNGSRDSLSRFNRNDEGVADGLLLGKVLGVVHALDVYWKRIAIREGHCP